MASKKKNANIKIVYVSDTTKEEVATVEFTPEEFDEIKQKAAELGVTVEDYFEEVMRVYLETYG